MKRIVWALMFVFSLNIYSAGSPLERNLTSEALKQVQKVCKKALEDAELTEEEQDESLWRAKYENQQKQKKQDKPLEGGGL